MKDYHEYPTIELGGSDIASLTVRAFGSRHEFFEIHFGGDGNYSAYLVDEEAEIGEYYNLVEVILPDRSPYPEYSFDPEKRIEYPTGKIITPHDRFGFSTMKSGYTNRRNASGSMSIGRKRRDASFS